MLSTSLITAALASLPALVLSADPAPGTSRVEVELTIDDTSLVARNLTDLVKLLVVRDEDGHAVAWVKIPARGEVAIEGPARAVHAAQVELVARSASGATVSRVIELAGARVEGISRVEFERCESGYCAWGTRAASPRNGPVAPSLNGTGGPDRCLSPSPPPHVPVITPSDGRKGDLPPKLERTPLPPV